MAVEIPCIDKFEDTTIMRQFRKLVKYLRGELIPEINEELEDTNASIKDVANDLAVTDAKLDDYIESNNENLGKLNADLNDKIEAEASVREIVDDEIKVAIDVNCDDIANLNDTIESEIQHREDGDTILNNAITQEIADRATADSALMARMDMSDTILSNVKDSLDVEIETRKEGDALILNQIVDIQNELTTYDYSKDGNYINVEDNHGNTWKLDIISDMSMGNESNKITTSANGLTGSVPVITDFNSIIYRESPDDDAPIYLQIEINGLVNRIQLPYNYIESETIPVSLNLSTLNNMIALTVNSVMASAPIVSSVESSVSDGILTISINGVESSVNVENLISDVQIGYDKNDDTIWATVNGTTGSFELSELNAYLDDKIQDYSPVYRLAMSSTDKHTFSLTKDSVVVSTITIEVPDVDLSDYYTKEEVDELIPDVVETDLSDYYTKEEVDELIPEKIEVDLSDYYNKSEIDNMDMFMFQVGVENWTVDNRTYNGTRIMLSPLNDPDNITNFGFALASDDNKMYMGSAMGPNGSEIHNNYSNVSIINSFNMSIEDNVLTTEINGLEQTVEIPSSGGSTNVSYISTNFTVEEDDGYYRISLPDVEFDDYYHTIWSIEFSDEQIMRIWVNHGMFCICDNQKSLYISAIDDEFTEDEIKEIKNNEVIIKMIKGE